MILLKKQSTTTHIYSGRRGRLTQKMAVFTQVAR